MHDDDDLAGDLNSLKKMLKEDSKVRRAKHRENAPILLTEAGIPFTSSNDGAHLIILSNPRIDFWPGTGKWIVRTVTPTFTKRGIFPLLRYLKKQG